MTLSDSIRERRLRLLPCGRRALRIEIPNVPMLIDTGADVSLLPRVHVALIPSPDAKQYELEGFDGAKSLAPAITAELQLLGKSFLGQFLLIDGWHGILGRNILNNLSLLLDGPSRTWLEQPRSDHETAPPRE